MSRSWLHRLLKKKSRPVLRSGPNKPTHARFLPAVESLADRVLPAVTATFLPNAGTLSVFGDAQDNTIVVSRVFDRPSSPRYAIEYLLYHEMLHLKHPVRVKAGRRCVHSREFQAEERLFPHLEEAKSYLRRL